ncbi:uracil-DNA glycosylase [Burkholderia multivorans]|nr:uracil-DNA glycosylase [Burkholderia multivorans]PRE67252.1 uracil-DNA glycosylase [Burkholderia multivorans]PRF10506.1 uracil-DNA glycosylase [Burkholderia multivorans]
MTDTLPDLIAPHLDMFLSRINPHTAAAATGHHVDRCPSSASHGGARRCRHRPELPHDAK